MRKATCDVCGEPADERDTHGWTSISVAAPPPEYRKTFDLCWPCTKVLGRLLTAVRDERRGTREPGKEAMDNAGGQFPRLVGK